jgi:hypothetical protein
VFLVENALVLLRDQILTLPKLIAAELRDLSNEQSHRVRMRVESSVHRFLEQLAENMQAAMHAEEFLKKLEAEMTGKDNGDEDARARKKDAANEKRRAEYQQRKKI